MFDKKGNKPEFINERDIVKKICRRSVQKVIMNKRRVKTALQGKYDKFPTLLANICYIFVHKTEF